MFTHWQAAGVASMLAAVTPAALAIEPVFDFGITDEPSYQAFRGAISASEYVRYDYVSNRSPRVVGVTTALVSYATRNPLADATQLQQFVAAYDQALATAFAGDADLNRPSHFLPAVQFSTPLADPALAGTDTNVGAEVLELLDLDVPEPDNFESMRQRMVQFERSLSSSLVNSPEWAGVLVIGFSGQDLAGNANEHLAGVLRAYLEAEGFEPVPDGIDDDRFEPVDDALLEALPSTYADYQVVIAQPLETSDAWNDIAGAFSDVAAATDARVAELESAMMNEPTLIESAANAGDPTLLAQALEDYRMRLDDVAGPRTIVSAGTMILFQSAQTGSGDLARNAREFSSIQLETNETAAGATAGIQILAGIGTTAVGFGLGVDKVNPATWISGIASIASGGVQLVDLFSGTSTPSAEDLMFDEMKNIRNQVEEMRVELNERFDRIETQLSIIQTTLTDGLNALGDDISDLTADVEALSRDMFEARSSLQRIEDALWGVAQDVLLFELTVLTNDVLDYRDDTGVDLMYSSADPNFVSGASDLFSWATTTAGNQTFAGDEGSTMTLENVLTRLDGSVIGRSINDLREFPFNELGLPRLNNDRVVGPAPWAQSASAYAQLAKESPWYFAYMYGLQSGEGGSEPDLDQIIAEGMRLQALAAAARDQDLFDALFAGYDAEATAAGAALDAAVADVLADEMLPAIDPWGGPDQDVSSFTVPFTELDGRDGLQDFPIPGSALSRPWDIYGGTNIPQMASVLVRGKTAMLGGSVGESHQFRVTANGFVDDNDLEFLFQHQVDGDDVPGESHPELIRRHTRRVLFEVSNTFGDEIQFSSDSNAQDFVEEDFIRMQILLLELMLGQNQTGDSILVFGQDGDTYVFDVVSDTNLDDPAFPASPYVLQRLDELQDAVWFEAATESQAYADANEGLQAYEALIDAYVTLGMPDMFERSATIQAALRGDIITGELSLEYPLDLFAASQFGGGDGGLFPDLAGMLLLRSSIAKSEIDHAIALPSAGHSYVDWMLAELRQLRDHTHALAIDDTYATASGVTLVVPTASGVIVNDVDQQYRAIEVDTAFTGAMPLILANGVLDLAPDGSFIYTPNPGFSGTETFSYRSFTTVNTSAPPVFSDPANVVILVGTSNSCNPADLDGNGVLNFDDIDAFVAGFLGGDLIADLDGNGTLNFDDIDAFVNAFLAGCSG